MAIAGANIRAVAGVSIMPIFGYFRGEPSIMPIFGYFHADGRGEGEHGRRKAATNPGISVHANTTSARVRRKAVRCISCAGLELLPRAALSRARGASPIGHQRLYIIQFTVHYSVKIRAILLARRAACPEGAGPTSKLSHLDAAPSPCTAPPRHKVGTSNVTLLCLAGFPTSPPPETLGASRQPPKFTRLA
jgi:hypothetical protein